MRLVRTLAALAIATTAVTLASCTSLLGDFNVGAGDDASVADSSGGDSPVTPDSTPDTMPADDSSTDAADAADACSGLVCNGVCVPNDTKNCGSCGHDCTNLPHVSGAVACRSGGVCSFVASSCAPGFADCNNMPNDGCEADMSNTAHCGTCTTMCTGGTPVCVGAGDAGSMTFSCASGCPVNMPTLCSGTCVDLNTNALNCMTCGHACPNVANGQPGCAAGACGVGSCNVNFQNCDSDPTNGCEVNTQTDPAHCGSCAGACSLPRATAGCAAGMCTVVSCTAGFGDCNNMASDGCEVNINTDSAHCGPACIACAGGKTCQGGTCSCPSGTMLCGANCVDLQTDGANCNACGRSCLGGTCNAGVCQPLGFVTASQISFLQDFDTDGTVVVWADGDNTIDQVSTPGGTKIVLATATIVSSARGIAASKSGSGNVNWFQYDGTSTTHVGLATIGTAGSGTIVASFAGVTNGAVYDPGGTVAYTLKTVSPVVSPMKCPFNGTGGCTVLTNVSSSQASFDIAFSPPILVFGDVTNSNVYQVNVNNLAKTTIAGQSTAFHVAADASSVYWIQGSSQTMLNRAPLGGTATTTLTNAAGTPIASDGVYVYFVGSGISYMPVGGGAITAWLAGFSASHFRLANGALYFDSGGAIYRVKTP